MSFRFLLPVVGSLAIVLSPSALSCNEYTDTNDNHVAAGRAYTETVSSWWWSTTTNFYAEGSANDLGTLGSTVVTLKEDPIGYFEEGECPIQTGTPPQVTDTGGIMLQDPVYTPIDIEIVDEDSDLISVSIEVTSQRDANFLETITCDNYTVSGTIYTIDECNSVTINDWGKYDFTIIAEDQEGNITEQAITNITIKEGSSAPAVVISGHQINGTVLNVTGVVTDVDNDVEGATLGIGFLGNRCDIDGSTFDCNFDMKDLTPGMEANFAVLARDSVDNFSDMNDPNAQLTVIVPEASLCVTASNTDHIDAGRAYLMYGMLVYSTGAAEYLGMQSGSSSLEEVEAGVWQKVTSCE